MSLNERKMYKTATQRKHEAKKVVLDQYCNDLSLAIKKKWCQKAIWNGFWYGKSLGRSLPMDK